MGRRRFGAMAWAFAAALSLAPFSAQPQGATGGATVPAAPGLAVVPPTPGTPQRGRRPRGLPSNSGAASGVDQKPRKPTAAERAERRKLERDLQICIGC